jgi:ABC-type transport system involved in cytochrome bd biosynthesis fused ATPase/permease subunit
MIQPAFQPKATLTPTVKTSQHINGAKEREPMPQTPSPDASAIRSENLSVFYGDAAAVKSVNLGFEANKVSAIIGPPDAARARSSARSTG